MSFLHSRVNYRQLNSIHNKKIVFYSEGASYWINFKSIIKSLIEEHEQTVYYITSSQDDPALNNENEYFRTFYIGSEFFRILLFETLRADVFLTTLPDIGTFHLKRPPGVKTFIYVNHTLGSMNMIFLPGAFDSYDVIMCAGPHQILEVKEMEEFYGTKAKTLIPAGYPPLDDLLERLQGRTPPQNTPPVATIAPSWQADNIIDRVARPLIDSLLASGFTVRLRPHPRTLAKEGKKVRSLADAYAGNELFTVDNSPGSFDSYLTTDLLVTDWSGTGFKFAFAMLRPVLFINTPPKARNPDYKVFKNIPVETAWRNIVGASLEEDNIDKAGILGLQLISNTSSANQLEYHRNQSVFNVLNSGRNIARTIIDLLTE
jgi:YidC/Oxa1 family membrane protein insertase